MVKTDTVRRTRKNALKMSPTTVEGGRASEVMERNSNCKSEGKNVDGVPCFKGPLQPAGHHWFWWCLLQRADTGVITIRRDLWKEYSLNWISSCIWRGSVPLDVVRLNRALWLCFLRRSLPASLVKRGPTAGFDFYGRLVQSLKEDLGLVAGSFSWGQASCMSLGVFSNKILKKGLSFSTTFASFSTKFASFSTKWWYQDQSESKQWTATKNNPNPF